jgi:type IX secretion system PorP/SprF family membrane protein
LKTRQIKYSLVIFIMINIYASIQLKAQDAHFSQFCNAPLSMNPSAAGSFNSDMRVLTNYRNQWRSISAPYKTFAFSYDMGIRKKEKRKTSYLGAGISFMNDKAGDAELSLNQVNLSFAYHLRTSTYNTISVGIQGGYAQRSINFENLQWDSQFNGSSFDPNLPSNEPANFASLSSYSDFGTGVQWTYSKGEMYSTANDQLMMNAGVAAFHVNKPDLSFYSTTLDNLPMKIVVHATSQIGFKNTKNSIVPALIYMQQGPLKNIIAGFLVRRSLMAASKYTGNIKGAAISFGGLYRVGDAVIPQVQIEFANYAIGFSYDINISGLTNITAGKGGFEISLRFINPNPFTGRTNVPMAPK